MAEVLDMGVKEGFVDKSGGKFNYMLPRLEVKFEA